MAYEVPPLPYDYNALEPTIDEATMEIHHDKHHQAYVTNLNAALEGTEWADKPVEDVLTNLDSLPAPNSAAVRNNARRSRQPFAVLGVDVAGWWWRARGDLAAAIDEAFGGFDDFKAQFNDAGVKRFGSGWTGWCTTARASR